MKTKDEALLELRGTALGITNEDSSAEERFQNQTLRPILKLQNELLLEVFINYAKVQKGVFFELSLSKKQLYIENALQKDVKFSNSLKGMIIGLFTIAEYKEYSLNTSNINKRIGNLLMERFKSQMQLLEKL
ncbi:glyoxalase [Flavobacterium psychraquaticum]|uniref:glyoxalase n=1 Tax=Flavobacterium psychraquaticum TaxID=3103958 RepID=UPI002ACE1A3C|nr:glyoxalase [Flavobacterium sp. LB-N7T]